MSSAILALPLSSAWGSTCALSPIAKPTPGLVSERVRVDPRMPEYANQHRSGWRRHDVANPGARGTPILTPCSLAARDRSAPNRSCREWITSDSASPSASASPTQLRCPPTKSRLSPPASSAERGRAALQYGDYVGYSGLIDALIAKLSRDQGIQARRENVLITAGGSQAIDLLLDALVDWGDTIVSEMPTWVGAVQAFRNVGANIISIPVDDEGIDVTVLGS